MENGREYDGLEKFWSGMQRKLRENDHKPSWKDESLDDILTGFFTEVVELRNDYHSLLMIRQWIVKQGPTPVLMAEFGERARNFRRECYDVANFAFFAWDIMGMILQDMGDGELAKILEMQRGEDGA